LNTLTSEKDKKLTFSALLMCVLWRL